MATMWEYKACELQSAEKGAPSAHDVDEILNAQGKLGYQIVHIKERENGTYFLILARDTNRPVEDEEGQKDWLVDVVTAPDSELSRL